MIGPAAYSDAAGGKRVTEAGDRRRRRRHLRPGRRLQLRHDRGGRDQRRGGKNVWFIDVIGDKTSIDKGHLLSSVLWNMVPVYSAMIEDLKADTFGTHNYKIGLADNSVALLKTKHIPDDVWASMKDLRQQIIDGKIKVPEIYDAQAVRALMTTVSAAAQ